MALILGFDNICTCGKEFNGQAYPIVILGGISGLELLTEAPVVKDGCAACKKQAAEMVEEKYYAELDALTFEERLRRVEKWIRNFKHQELRHISRHLY